MKRKKAKKTHTRKKKLAWPFSLFTSRGNAALYVILMIVIVSGLFLVGGFFSDHKPSYKLNYFNVGACCDTGDGEACKPQKGPDQTLTYDGAEYGLLRTSIKFIEGNLHLKEAGQTSNGGPVILNISDTTSDASPFNPPADCRPGEDKYFRKYAPPEDLEDPFVLVQYCVSTPNEQIIFVCKQNCFETTCPAPYLGQTSCYGDADTVFDVYFRIADENNVPDFIKNCDKSGFPAGTILPDQELVTPTNYDKDPRYNLHLNTFWVTEKGPNNIPWLSPLCKPAIYLYPEEKTNTNVQVNPVGKMLLTIPAYPTKGWDVTAYPDGKLDYHNNTTFDYLYYEAEIPDEKIQAPTEGFVVEKGKVNSLLTDLLPKLGLNAKESKQFKDYWLGILPDAKYFFVGIVPQSHVDSLAPLNITPKPKTVIRVILYFQALDENKKVNAPSIVTPKRDGFTVVEWGGIFKRDENHPFSCLM